MKTPKKEKLAEDRSDYYWLALCLLAGLLMGVFFIFLLPPWQHYDEPKHFEHVWLAANLDRLPGPEDRDEELNRQVMASMGLYRFYGDKRIHHI